MKIVVATALIAAALLPAFATAQDASAPATKPQRRGGAALQFELTAGGDDLDNDAIQISGTNLGQGGTLSFGGFYRPWEASRFELQGFLGYKIGWAVPVRGGGGEADISRWVVQLLGIHHTKDKLYVGGGLAYHANPKYTFSYSANLHFDNAVGVTVLAGWNWIGLQCTYMEYRAPQYGKFDASNCGVRFTFRFRKWRSLEPR
jgi:opacity protein-like surface antigen